MKCLLPLALIALAAIASGQTTPPQSLSVEDAVSFGLKNSPALRGAQAEIDVAKAETRAARSRLAPQIGLNGFGSQGSMPNVLQSAMGFEPQALVLAPNDAFADLNLMLMMPLYTGGSLSSLVSAAFALQRAAEFGATGMAAEVALAIRSAYSQSLYGASLVEVAKAKVEAAEAMSAVAKAQFEAGKGIEANVHRAQAELAEANQQLTMADNDRRKMLLDLLSEMGASLSATPDLSDRFEFVPLSGSLEGFIKKASERRGELLAAKRKADAAKANLDSKSGATKPQVYGFAMGDAFNPRDEMGNRSGYTAGIVASFPLFDGGMRRSEIAAARAMFDKAKSEVAVWELRTEKEVRQAWLDIETASKNYTAANAALTAAQAAYDVIKVRVEAGKSILVEQLDSLAVLTRAKANVAKATFDHYLAKARLARAVGETTSLAGGELK